MVKIRRPLAIAAIAVAVLASACTSANEPVSFSPFPTSDEEQQKILDSVLPSCEQSDDGFNNMCSTLVVDKPIPIGTTAAELSEQAYKYLSVKVTTSDELSRTVISGVPQLDEVGNRQILREIDEGEYLDETMFSAGGSS